MKLMNQINLSRSQTKTDSTAHMQSKRWQFPVVSCVSQKYAGKDVIDAKLDWSWPGKECTYNQHTKNTQFIVRIRDNGGTSYYKKYPHTSIRINSKFEIIYYGANESMNVVKYSSELVFAV